MIVESSDVPGDAWDAELLALRCKLADVKLTLAMCRFRDALRRDEKYRSDQPRVPAGNADGGRWTSEGGVAVGSVSLDDGSDENEDLLQPVLFQGYAAEKAAEAALYFYLYLAQRNSPDATASLGFNAQDFLPGASNDDPALRVGPLTREDVDEACPRHGLVLSVTDGAAAWVKGDGNYRTRAEYGTRVHSIIKGEIEALDNPNLVTERSYIKSEQEAYGTRGSIRVDVLENVGNGTVCVYDVKTGDATLNLQRMQEIANNVHSHYEGADRILLIEVKPK